MKVRVCPTDIPVRRKGKSRPKKGSRKGGRKKCAAGDTELCALVSDVQTRELRVTIDSGACDHVISPNEVDCSKIKTDTDAVKQSVTYYTASGQPLPNLGEINVLGSIAEGSELSMTMQVAGVNKTLASVRKMCEAGNRVVFEDLEDNIGGYVESKSTGVRVPIHKEGGTYQVVLSVPDLPRVAAINNIDDDGNEDDEGPARDTPSFRRLP